MLVFSLDGTADSNGSGHAADSPAGAQNRSELGFQFENPCRGQINRQPGDNGNNGRLDHGDWTGLNDQRQGQSCPEKNDTGFDVIFRPQRNLQPGGNFQDVGDD